MAKYELRIKNPGLSDRILMTQLSGGIWHDVADIKDQALATKIKNLLNQENEGL